MELQEKDSCRLDDTIYPSGAKVCCEGYCQFCKDGLWVDTKVQEDSY